MSLLLLLFFYRDLSYLLMIIKTWRSVWSLNLFCLSKGVT